MRGNKLTRDPGFKKPPENQLGQIIKKWQKEFDNQRYINHNRAHLILLFIKDLETMGGQK